MKMPTPLPIACFLVAFLASIPAVAGTGNTLPDIKTLEARWKTISFDAFLEDSWNVLLMRNPELVTEYGLDAALGMPGDRLNDLSEEYILETESIERFILQRLRRFPVAGMTAARKDDLRIYGIMLEDSVEGQKYRYFDYYVHPTVSAAQIQTESFFTQVMAVRDKAEAERYVRRLSLVKAKMRQIAEAVTLRAGKGIVLPRPLLDHTRGMIQDILGSRPEDTSYYEVFRGKVSTLAISGREKERLLESAARQCEVSVIPGYRILDAALEAIGAGSPAAIGVSTLPGGRDYYDYCLKHYTTTDMTADRIHALGLEGLETIHAAMRKLFKSIGMEETRGLVELYAELSRMGRMVGAADVVRVYEELAAGAEKAMKPHFDRWPKAAFEVVADRTGGYYIAAPVDGSRPGVFYAADAPAPYFQMPTLLFHETVPGHHLQISLGTESALPSFRKGANFLGFVEGWALYAEKMMFDIGYYADDPAGALGFLQSQAFRAARLVADTGIHAKGWSFERASAFMADNTGFPPGRMEYEVGRYAAWPGQAVAYMTGMLAILDLRKSYEKKMGSSYNLKDFHSFVLDGGAVPLSWLAGKLE